MVPDIVSNILLELSTLLVADISPRSISCQFDKIAQQVANANLHFGKIDCREYYEDVDLALILMMKNEAISNALFEQASTFRVMENELRVQKGLSELTSLKTEDCYFEYRNHGILFHYNKKLENQRLIANLIEGYNLVHKKSVVKLFHYS